MQYAGARFTITPMTAARAAEAEVKFAQGAKPGKGGQLPGKKVSPRIAHQRGCEPGYELVSPPVNHNLYSIEDVKLMLESWRHLNPDVALRAQVRRDARRRDGVRGRRERGRQPPAPVGRLRRHRAPRSASTRSTRGVPVAAVLPAVQDMLVEEGVRDRVEVSASTAACRTASRR